MDRKIMIAVIVAIGFMMLYPYYMKKINPQAEQTQQETGKSTAVGAGAVAVETTRPALQLTAKGLLGKAKGMIGMKKTKPKRSAEDRAAYAKELAAIGDTVVLIETPLYSATVSSIGGGLKNFELKKYKETQKEDSPFVNMSSRVADVFPLQTSLALEGLPKNVIFNMNTNPIKLSDGDTRTLILEWISANGVKIEKSYTFSGSSYIIDTNIKVINKSEKTLTGTVDNILTATFYEKFRRFHSGPVTYEAEDTVRLDADDPTEIGEGRLSWLGLEDKFFLLAFMPKSEIDLTWKQGFLTEDTARTELSFPVSLKPGENQSVDLSAFIGPKEYRRLKLLPGDIEEAIQFGFFSFMAKPVLVLLNFFQRYLVNYGIAIILLTLLFKIAFYPLSKKSLKSMNEMKKLSPQMKKIKEKFKDDKQRQSKETMELYKRHKVNPLGGCLPMVLQIPVFIALYEVLSVSIDLRHAHFIFWITDLSAADPYYISPILMGGSMFLQQKMSPTSMDPSQARMMMMMPIVFTFLFLNFPTGLVIYWLVNNILTIVQQYQVQRSS